MDLVPTLSTHYMADAVTFNFEAISKWSKDTAGQINELAERVERTMAVVVRLEETEAARVKREEETEARLSKLEEEMHAKHATADETKVEARQEAVPEPRALPDITRTLAQGHAALGQLDEIIEFIKTVRISAEAQSVSAAARDEELELLRKRLAESEEAAAKARKDHDDQLSAYKEYEAGAQERLLALELERDELARQLAIRGADLATSNAKLAVAEEAIEKLTAALTGLDGPCIPRYVKRSSRLNKIAHEMGCPVLDGEADVYKNAVTRLVDGQVNNIGFDRKRVTEGRLARITLQQEYDIMATQLVEKTVALRKAEAELTREKDELMVQTKCSEVAQEERQKLQEAYEAMAAEKASLADQLKLALDTKEATRVHSHDYWRVQGQTRILTERCMELEKKLADLATEKTESEKRWEMAANTWERRYWIAMDGYRKTLGPEPENDANAPVAIAGATLVASPNPPVLVNPNDFSWVRATDVPASAAAETLVATGVTWVPSAPSKGKDKERAL